jgi:hypothetical protein
LIALVAAGHASPEFMPSTRCDDVSHANGHLGFSTSGSSQKAPNVDNRRTTSPAIYSLRHSATGVPPLRGTAIADPQHRGQLLPRDTGLARGLDERRLGLGQPVAQIHQQRQSGQSLIAGRPTAAGRAIAIRAADPSGADRPGVDVPAVIPAAYLCIAR